MTTELTATNLTTLAEQINEEHRACETAAQSALAHALTVGRLLTEAKDRCPRGTWTKWVVESCPEISKRSVQVYMRLAMDEKYLPDDEAQRAALSIRAAGNMVRREKIRQLEKVQAKAHGTPPQALQPADPTGRKLQISRNKELRGWSIRLGPNQAGMLIPERLQELEQDAEYVGWQEDIDDLKLKAKELRTEADKLEKKARTESGNRGQAMKATVEAVHGKAIAYTESWDFYALDDETDRQIEGLRTPGRVAKFLLNGGGGDKVDYRDHGIWGDMRHWDLTHDGSACGQPSGWHRAGGYDGLDYGAKAT